MAYGAAIDCKTTSDVGIYASVPAAKSRFAPRKIACFPRFELCSIVLGCKLLKCVLKSIQTLQLVVDVSAWGDSTIALAWIRSTPNRNSTFVIDGIAKVQTDATSRQMETCPSHQNPADHAT